MLTAGREGAALRRCDQIRRRAEPLAVFENGEIAAASVRIGGAVSIYTALYKLPSGLLRRLLEDSGVFFNSDDERVYVYPNEAFLGVYNATDGDASVRVRRDGAYRDLLTGETFSAQDGRIVLPRRTLRAYMLREQ